MNMNAIVYKIEWERVHLILSLKLESEDDNDWNQLEFYGVNNLGRAKIKFEKELLNNGQLRLKTNITNNGENRCVPRGTYRIYVCIDDKVLTECEMDSKLANHLDSCSRSFSYSNFNKIYNVFFFLEDTEEKMLFRMYVLNSSASNFNFPKNKSFFKQFHFWKKFKESFLSHRSIIRRIYQLILFFYKKQRKKTVLFMSEQSDAISSNLKAVSDRMIERNLDKEFKILFSARKASSESQSKLSWLSLILKLAKSGTIFIDDHVPVFDWLKIDEETKIVQLWHAGAGFKSSGYSRWGHRGCPAPQSCHRQYTYGITGSKHIAHFFSEVWGINEEHVLPTGMPRMDEYLNENFKTIKIRDLYEKYPLCIGKKIILFAPTYRGKNRKNAYYPYELLDFEKLYEICGKEYVILFKADPWVNNELEINDEYKDKFIDVKDYPNINDLFYITDLLITDYSSNIFEYSLMRKPMVFYAFDKVQYSISRGFHRNYEEAAPGKVCYTFDELVDALVNRDFEYEKVEKYIEQHFDHIDNNASDRVIDWILLNQLPEDIKENIEKKKNEMKKMKILNFSDIKIEG